MNECFCDDNKNLVDENHPYKACRGTPNQYPASAWWDHAFNDSGGIWAEGRSAYEESNRHARDREAGELRTR